MFKPRVCRLRGGALSNESLAGEVRIANATFFGNRAVQGSAFNNTDTIGMKNSIVEGVLNAYGEAEDVCATSTDFDGENNLIGTFGKIDQSCGNAVFSLGAVSDLDSAAVDNGGPCVGVSEDCTVIGPTNYLPTHKPDVTSNAADAGVDFCPDTAGFPLPFDQIGTARTTGAACDIGALEAI